MTKYLLALSAVLTLALALERDRHADTMQQLADMKAAGQAQARAAAEVERATSETITKILQENAHETTDLRRRASELADSLRDRPSVRPSVRPSAGSSPSTSPSTLPEASAAGVEDSAWCAGDRLYREHAEAFARQAALAASAQAALRACLAAPDGVVVVEHGDVEHGDVEHGDVETK